MPEYKIEWAHKNCHPETCNHSGDFKILEDDKVIDFQDTIEDAQSMIDIFKDMDKTFKENLGRK